MTQASNVLDRREAVKALLADRGDLLVVSGLGSSSYDVFDAGDHDGNFYLWGAMGGAAMMGLGLAQAQPRRPVLVVTGDGEQLMGVGSLATIGARQPRNLTVIVLDNGRFGETGMQLSHTSLGTDLVAVAKGCAIEDASTVATADQSAELAARIGRREGPTFVRVLIEPNEPPRKMPPRDGAFIKNRFRAALGLKPF
jgi:thiamine pyrophosphate-dependent acetolactate synthase large subunit-like protein